MADKVRLAFYSTNCKRCHHLDPQETRRYKCHHINGKVNKHCPAKEIEIVIVGKAMLYAAQVTAARDKRDAQTEARILAIVAKQTDSFKERFYFALENPEIQE